MTALMNALAPNASTKTTDKKPATISISAKCSDLFWMEVLNAAGESLGQGDGYVPDFFPEEHYGDYVQLDIDLATGKILNWKKPAAKAVMSALKELDPR